MTYPTITISKQGEQFLRKGQMWMFKNNVEKLDPSIENGSEIKIMTVDHDYLGTGLLSLKSHITVRIYSKNENQKLDRDFFYSKIKDAYEYRKTVEYDNISNCRLVFGEADGLPGLIVDRYNDIIVTQVSTYPLEKRKDMIYEIVLEILKEDGQEISGIYERNDIQIRQKEGLEMYKGFYKNSFDTKTVINENGLLLNVDVENGQKTGYFLDQKSNRYLLRKMSRNKNVCDCFSHTGGFALNAALGHAKHVDAVDVSQVALDQGYQNACLNHLEDRISFIQDDVFDYLDKCKQGQYDIIVLDPPAFTKSRRTIDHAYQGYKKINLKAMNLLRNHGYLITCSCSRFMETDNFEKMLKEAALEADVSLKQVSVTQQNADHPILLNMDETSYLKFFIFQIISND